ncbi:MAG: DUF348 domain-containing protein [Anaerolineae bacterium]|nr:DUF348 domain-containing protein [Anaerolineae bacterium]
MTRPVKLFLIFSFALLFLGGILVTAWALSQDVVTVWVDGQPVRVVGEYNTVAEVLAAANITLHPADLIYPPPHTPLTAAATIRIERATPITLRNQNGTHTYFTHQTTLTAWLNEIGLRVQPTDQIYADGQPLPYSQLAAAALPQQIEIGTFVTITLYEGGQQKTIRTAVPTVGAALVEAGIDLHLADLVSPAPHTPLTANLTITVQRAHSYTILADNQTIPTRHHSVDVLTVLNAAGVRLIGEDYTRPPANSLLQPGQTIQVIRVREAFRLIDTPIPYETVLQPTDLAEIDQRIVLQAGVPGIQRQRLRVRYENGVEVSQEFDEEWTAQAPTAEIVGYGTQIVIRVLATPDGGVEYWRVVRMRVTSYTAASSGKELDDPTYGITASGVAAGTGIVAVDRTVVPFRTFVYVPGYGIGFVGDTGGGVLGRWIDLGYDEAEFVGWSGYVDVYYLTPVPPVERINFLIPTTLP